jgi:hypothetical protein
MELASERIHEEEDIKDGGKELEIEKLQPLITIQGKGPKNFSLEILAEAVEEAFGDYQALLNLKQLIDQANNLSFQEKYQLGCRLKALINDLLFPSSSKE